MKVAAAAVAAAFGVAGVWVVAEVVFEAGEERRGEGRPSRCGFWTTVYEAPVGAERKGVDTP